MNWGYKLLAAFIVFAGGMSYLVVRSVKTDFELVEKDYYDQEILYQQVIDGSRRVNQLSGVVSIERVDSVITITLPPEMAGQQIEGTAWFYCSYAKSNDRKFDLNSYRRNGQQFSFPRVPAGTYTVKLRWSASSLTYFTEKYLTVP